MTGVTHFWAMAYITFMDREARAAPSPPRREAALSPPTPTLGSFPREAPSMTKTLLEGMVRRELGTMAFVVLGLLLALVL
jgi:hypothetical protein